MEQQVKIGNIISNEENESAKQQLLRTVKQTEQKLLKEGKLVQVKIDNAIIMTTCPEKYNRLIH